MSSNIKIKDSNVARLQFVYGEGIENYMNDAPADVGIQKNGSNAVTPVMGIAIPVTGVVAFLDHSWSEKYSSSIGYSMCKVDNPELDSPGAFHRGQYAIVNLSTTRSPNMTTGIEVQYGKRENFRDGFSSDDVRMEFSAKYNFSKVMR